MTPLGEMVCARLEAVAEPGRAAAMRAYMKSDMPYLGVSAVPLRRVCTTLFKDLRYETAASWQDDVLGLWRGAKFRDERYAALELSGLLVAQKFHRFEAISMYEEIVDYRPAEGRQRP